MQVHTTGRSDLDNLFSKSGCLDGTLSHNPFLAFAPCEDGVQVVVVTSATALAQRFPPETPVMVQWPGRWSSDFFMLTAGDVRRALDEREAEERRIKAMTPEERTAHYRRVYR